MRLSRIPQGGKVAVVGGGISGLAYGYFLTRLRPDVRISVFEISKQPGGWIKSETLHDQNGNGIILEKGPRTLRGVSNGTLLIIDILKRLGLSSSIEAMRATSVANRKFLLGHNSELVQVPSSVSSGVNFFLNELTSGVIGSVLREPFRRVKAPSGDESIESFFQRRFGSRILTDNILSAVLHGIYAGDVAKLSVRSIFPRMVEMEKEHGSIIRSVMKKVFSKKDEPQLHAALKAYEEKISADARLGALSAKLKPFPMLRLEGGLQRLPSAIAAFLKDQKNVNVVYEASIKSIDPVSGVITHEGGSTEQFDHIRSTIDAQALAGLLQNTPGLSQTLSSVEYVGIFLVNIYSKKPILIPQNGNGFGFLVPKSNQNRERLLGVIYDSDTEQNVEKLFGQKGAEKGTYHKITLMMGGHFYNDETAPSTSVNLAAVNNIIRNILLVEVGKHKVHIRDEASLEDKTVSLGEDDLLISYNWQNRCIPQFNVGYEVAKNRVQLILEEELKGKLSLGGMCFGGGVGVPDCVFNALEGALEVE